MPKPCTNSIIECGGALVQLRHHLEKAEKLYDRAFDALEKTKPDLKAVGMKGMAYGVALDKLNDARRGLGLVMAAHEHMAAAVCACDMETPTDEQLVGIIGTLNWR